MSPQVLSVSLRNLKRDNSQIEYALTGYVNPPGVFQISCKVEDSIQAQAVIDTGASTSMVSKGLVQKLPTEQRKVCSFPTQILTANGNPWGVEGKLSLLIEIEGFFCSHTFLVVSDLPSLILGMDLANSPFVMDPSKQASVRKDQGVGSPERQTILPKGASASVLLFLINTFLLVKKHVFLSW